MNSQHRASLTRVGVYGTLKKGQSNHQVLAGSHFVGRCQLSQICLCDLGPYPGAMLRSSEGIEVEVYDVSEQVFAGLDELEDYNPQSPHLGDYDRRQMETDFGLAWVYLYNGDVTGLPEIRWGGWPIS
ncbi:gamma-glutamylcyclotransferase family protein [Marinobacter sp. ATCH36]|uniref:gamma-glutamylcyclotransferase family protein n=1 Tax=Marinobacter sp. ATCH36 TaxID=2945106 RepID=UPI00201FB8F8|nr:gamma-glutamylcyclotransferase family protein [Marinobacter sp. ATCH36]MCL7943945.1 gamma-glutamylcyclotransferase [Marinobacter sp. ATCH36]